jgi:hypothetical protein
MRERIYICYCTEKDQNILNNWSLISTANYTRDELREIYQDRDQLVVFDDVWSALAWWITYPWNTVFQYDYK